MPDNNSVLNRGITSDGAIRTVLTRHIKRALDTRAFTRAQLARESGVHLATIDKIMNPGDTTRRVAAEDALCLAYALGESAVSALAGCINYTASRHDEDDVQPASIVATLMEQGATIAKAAADGRFDHVERPLCRDAADAIIATVLPLSSAGVR
ncbi:hypothetical protein [Novosphingobium olei]|uniref:hypothetical protein n=1 Tax=Novosphingobium olei TaxID=2728851 RepID=UPI003093612A|nr:helix-turn-helix domain-containing protein [Novosphingobium olei]